MNKNTSFAIAGANTFVHARFYDRMLEANHGGIVYAKNHLRKSIEVRNILLSHGSFAPKAYRILHKPCLKINKKKTILCWGQIIFI